MSTLPSSLEADEAQYGHYNDGHDYTSTTANRPTMDPIIRTRRRRTHHDDSQHSMKYQHDHDRDHSHPHHNAQPANIHYGRIPQRASRRYKTLRKVELFHGNFVLDSAVPTKLLDMCALRNEREFTHMQYSAATCDPNDFKDAGFTLRQVHYDPPRRTELFIVMTMCNEDEELFCRSIHGVIKNIAHLCQRDRSRTWGKDGWKKVVVCIVSDGRQNINPRTLSVLAMMGAYQEGIAKNSVDGRPVAAHIYEYTTQVSVSVTPSLQIEEKDIFPVQIIFCLKERDQGKLNSHRWFFNALAPILQPNICVLLDVGMAPGPTSIYHLWKIFDIKANVAGACGEIAVDMGTYGQRLLNPLVAAQNFEYKMSNILDKPLESVFGYISVLSGAFSAYRFIALQNDERGEGPLKKYFLGEKMHGAADSGRSTTNIYSAAERTLCWELVSKRGGAWILHYVKSAYAVTDVPHSVSGLISHRRCWFNGYFFVTMQTIVRFPSIYRSSHSLLRKFWIHVEVFYQLCDLIFSWFSLGNYYISFIVFTSTLEHYLSIFHYPNLVLKYFYLLLLIMSFLLALCHRSQCLKWQYTMVLLGFSMIMMYMTASAFLLAYKGIDNIARSQDHGIQAHDFLANTLFRNIILSTTITLGLCIVSSLLSFEPWHLMTSLVQYLLMIPSYIMVFNIHSFADIYDVPWDTVFTNTEGVPFGEGMNEIEAEVAAPPEETEPDTNAAYERAIALLSSHEPKATEKTSPPAVGNYPKARNLRTNLLLIWTLSNALLAMVVTSAIPSSGIGEMSVFVNVYMSVILFSITGLTAVRFLGSTVYLIVRLLVGE